jgi:hypothetical protein
VWTAVVTDLAYTFYPLAVLTLVLAFFTHAISPKVEVALTRIGAEVYGHVTAIGGQLILTGKLNFAIVGEYNPATAIIIVRIIQRHI